MSLSLPPRARRPSIEVTSFRTAQDLIENQIPELLGAEACLLHPRKNYDGGPGGGDFDYAVRRIDHQWPLRATGVRICQCIRHSPGGWYWVIETSDDVLAIDALDDPLGIGNLNFPTRLAFANKGSHFVAVRAAFVTMKRLAKRMRDDRDWDPIIRMAKAEPGTYARCLMDCLGRRLGREISASVLAGRTPGDKAWKRAFLSLRVRRIRTPRRAVTLLVRTLERSVGRLLQPTGLIVMVVGPDGAGKSALASALIARCGPFFWKTRRIHWRPGLLPRAGALVGRQTANPETPHDSAPHSRMVSIVTLLYYWLDFLLGAWLKLKPLRVRSTLIVVERGWWDILVDPRRYRMWVPQTLTAMMGRLLPEPDITLVLDAPASVLLQRKRELPMTELERQSHMWRELAQSRRACSVLDASQPESDVQAAATEKIVSFLEKRTAARTGPGWLALPHQGRVRWMIPRASRSAALEGLRVYQPMTQRGRLVWEAARGAASLGALRLLPRGGAPHRAIRQALAPHIPPRGTVAVTRSNHAARFVALIIDGTGAASAVAKVALDEAGRRALDREASALRTLGPLLPAPLRAPQVLHQDDGLLLLEAVRWHPRLRPWKLPADVAYALGAFYATGQPTKERGPAHGDFAPWNLLEAEDGGWVAVDWESGHAEAPPFYDLFHFLVQSCALLGRPSQEAVLRGVAAAEGGVARLISAYADGAGISADDAGRHFLTYLRISPTTLNPAAPDYRAGMQVRERLERRLVSGSVSSPPGVR